MFKKILIANRGEIAVRIIRTCRELGVKTVAVYSDVDRLALHTRLADEAYYLGPPPARESYLAGEKIINIAKQCGAEAIHPGYGFLSENAVFADAVAASDLVFIGPPASAMRAMGDKTAARQMMIKAGVPTVPGSKDVCATVDEAKRVAKQIGYPILIKASAGGGGKGMRVAVNADELPGLFQTASSEAQSAFGDGRVYIEKYLQKPRHIEFQIFADHHGQAIYLGERECSIQRRHQKVIEEAPSCVLDEELRCKMGEAAVRAALACGYVNAGTIEFLLDAQRRFYFLEMNTRLQVEHPVTEMVTGLDLVRLQLEVADGSALPLTQEQVQLRGHAIECRIYAEDPEQNFAPSIGRISHMHKPDGFGIREDSGVYEGSEISIYYDPMIAKLVAWGADRQSAMARMLRALDEYEIGGVRTTIPFCLWALRHPKFQAGDFDTHFVQSEFFATEQKLDGCAGLHEAAALAAVLVRSSSAQHTPETPIAAKSTVQGWKLRGWRQKFRTER
jgi:acetyl-CoA carboxylase biotin carboxylase subunit